MQNNKPKTLDNGGFSLSKIFFLLKISFPKIFFFGRKDLPFFHSPEWKVRKPFPISSLEKSSLGKSSLGKSSRRSSFLLRQGLTLIELSIVILVLGIIMGILYANLNPGDATKQAKKLQVKQLAAVLEAQWSRYELEHEPLTEGTSLEELTQKTETWGGLKQEQVMDPWKRPYFICLDESSSRQICSYGSDGTPGGEGGEAQDFYLTEQSSWPAWMGSSVKKKN